MTEVRTCLKFTVTHLNKTSVSNMTEHITHITRDQLYHWTKRLESSPSAPIKDPDGSSLETLRSLNKIYTLQSLRVPRIRDAFGNAILTSFGVFPSSGAKTTP